MMMMVMMMMMVVVVYLTVSKCFTADGSLAVMSL